LNDSSLDYYGYGLSSLGNLGSRISCQLVDPHFGQTAKDPSQETYKNL